MVVVGLAAASVNVACFADDVVVPDATEAKTVSAAPQEPTMRDDVETEETTGSLIRHRKHHYTQVDTKQENADDLHAQQGMTDMSSMTGMRNPIQKN